MSDSIYRHDAIKAIETSRFLVDAKEKVMMLPSAQPERKPGKWIKLDAHAHLADHKCSACGQECYVPTCMGDPMYDFCPNCGADMRGEQE